MNARDGSCGRPLDFARGRKPAPARGAAPCGSDLPVATPDYRGQKPAPTRGAALIVALGVLVVLALLGTVFATMTGIERSVARNHLDKVRAQLLAESGIEHAIAELSRPDSMDIWRLDRMPRWIYFGGDRNGNGVVDAGDIDKNGDRVPDTNDLPVTEALSPSFFLDADGDGLPDAVAIGTRANAGISGGTDVWTHADKGNLYAVRVIDLGSKINVNNPHANLRTILNNLAAAIGGGVPANLGDTVVSERDKLSQQRFANSHELRARVGETVYQKIKPFVATVGWVDAKAVKPVPLSNRRGHEALGKPAIGKDIYAHREMRPAAFDPATGCEPRTPVNINHAPIEVLTAVLSGLKGVYVFEDKYTTAPYDWVGLTCKYDGSLGAARRGGPRPGTSAGVWISGRLGTLYETTPLPAGDKNYKNKGAWGIAQKIVEERDKPFTPPAGFTATGAIRTRNFFRSFQQFNRFIDDLDPAIFEPIPGYDAYPGWGAGNRLPSVGRAPAPGVNEIPMVRDVLKANFNPNVHLNELNPDETIALWVDKTDLTYHSFDFTFFPMGFFEVQSAGWVLDGQRRIVAEETVTSEVKVFECWRDTTQWDFMREWADDGAALSAVFSDRTGAEPTADDAALRSYPEYQSVGFLKGAAGRQGFDGYLALNTVRSRNGQGDFALHFDQGNDRSVFNAERGAARALVSETDAGGAAQGPWWDRLVGGAAPGSIANDGLLSERGASPGYANTNFNQHTGTLSMWVKPLFRPENAGRNRYWFSLLSYPLPPEAPTMVPWYNARGGAVTTGDIDGGYWVHPFLVGFVPNHNDGPGVRTYMDEGEWLAYARDDGYPVRTIMGGCGGRLIEKEFAGGNGSPTVNHIGHDHAQMNGWGNACMAHRWIHVAFKWDDRDGTGAGWRNFTHLYVNGRSATAGSVKCTMAFGPPSYNFRHNTRWGPTDALILSDIKMNGSPMQGAIDPPLLRIGAEADPVKPPAAAAERVLHNYTADATLDEVVLWHASDADFFTAWVEGRYYKENDAAFTSPVVDLGLKSRRALAPPGTASPPNPVVVSGGGSGAGGSTTVATTALPIPQTRLGIFAYAGYWPVADPVNDPSLQGLDGTVFSLAIVDPTRPSTEWMPMQAAMLGGTAVTDNTDAANPAAQPVVVPDRKFRYRVRMAPNLADPLNQPLRISPILDDVTITYYDQPPVFLLWVVGEE